MCHLWATADFIPPFEVLGTPYGRGYVVPRSEALGSPCVAQETLCMHINVQYLPMELTHVTTRVAAHFPMPPPPPPPLRVMVARPAQVTQVTQVPNPLLHEPLHGIPCDTTHPMWRHRGTAQPKPPPPPPPPLRGWVSSNVGMAKIDGFRNP